jgi:glucuronoarabinoxylan endo-1,4-beta-xylanase
MKRYADVRFIATVWTPPAWMKEFSRDTSPTCSDGTGACGGHLRSDMREELAEYLYAFYRAVQQECGVDLYGISLQNESAFIEWYVSCVYDPDEYRDALKAVGAKFAAEWVDCLLFGAEDMLGNITVNPYFGLINVDPVAKSYMGAAAVHGYTNGVDPLPTSTGAQQWSRLGQVMRGLGARAWMTETSGFPESWAGAMTIASNVAMAMHYADLSAWVFWSDAENGGQASEYALLTNFGHTQRSYASKMFYKFVRPGAARIGCDLVAGGLLGVAAHHPVDQTFTMVIINQGGATTLELAGGELPAQLTKYTSTATKHCVDEGSVASGGSIGIDGNSVTTLVGTGYDPAVSSVHPHMTAAATTAVAARPGGAAYGLDGRRLRDSGIANPGAGSRRGIVVVDGQARVLVR